MSPKEILRGKIKNLSISIPPEDFVFQGEKAAALLRSSPIWPRYSTVFLFLSINSEIDTRPLIETSLRDGKKVFAPRVEADRLVFYRILSPDGPWTKGPFGIRQPEAAKPADMKSADHGSAGTGDFPALILTPGMAFDSFLMRLGRGGGYYDRFFSELDAAGRQYTALGLCMDYQLVDKVPAGENDKRMNGLLTAKELIMADTSADTSKNSGLPDPVCQAGNP